MEVTMKVEVYRNLNNGKWSVRDAESKYVLGHAETVVLGHAEFVVHEAGRQRVLKERVKNVPAFIRGTLLDTLRFKPFRGREIRPANYGEWEVLYSIPVTYNPYWTSSFVDAELTEDEIHYADRVVLDTFGRVTANVYAFPKTHTGDWWSMSNIRNIQANVEIILSNRNRKLAKAS